MAASSNVKPIPDGFHSITPYLYVRRAVDALAFYGRAFDAKETLRLEGPNSTIAHAEMKIGDSTFMLADESPEHGFSSPLSLGGAGMALMIYVDSVDTVVQQAVGAGATIIQPVENQFYADRSGMVKDPFGHMWTVATHVEDVPQEELDRRAKEFLATLHEQAG